MNARYLILPAALCLLAACGGSTKDKGPLPVSYSKPAEGDRTIYGLACDGSNDSVVVLLPNAGGDPVTFNILKAMRAHRLYGKPQIGDWLGVLPMETDSTEAYSVVDLDEVKGTWTYQVMPEMKKRPVSGKAPAPVRMTAEQDSMRQEMMNLYMVPREYGFTLKRHSKATAVGHIQQSSTLSDDSPVEYPEVKNYTGWRPYNGKLILVRTENGSGKKPKEVNDTAEFLLMMKDTLVLKFQDGTTIGYHRKGSAAEANAAATAAAAKQAEKQTEELK